MYAYVDTKKLDHRFVPIQTRLPVYITMSTIPSRLRNTITIIKHFLTHVTGFEKIILNIPYRYERWPNFNVDVSAININDPRFVLNRTADYGPLTKLVGALHMIPLESITIICDDMCYQLDAFKDIAERQEAEPHKAFSFFVYPFSNDGREVMVPQGADLISSYTRNLDHFIDWWNDFKGTMGISNYVESPCFFVDDQVIGWYFQSNGIQLEQVDRKHRMIYIKGCDNSDKRDNLNNQTGDKSRDKVMNSCYIDLDKFNPL